MKHKSLSSVILFCLLHIYIITFCACFHHTSSTNYIEKVLNKYEIKEYSYFVTDRNHEEVVSKNNYNEKTDLGEKWIESFSLPIILSNEIRNGHINEDSLLSCYISVQSVIKDKLLVKDIIHIPENRPSILPLYNENASFYIRNLIHKKSPKVYDNFYKDILMIDDNYPWDTQSLLTTTKIISDYFDKQNILEYLPIGNEIPELFPTWYVENMFQVAGWYIFRINKHVVLWNSISDERNTLLCLKFIDLGKTIAIIHPYKEELSLFDSNGNPDLLLSPIALDIIKNTFEPDCSEIDYNISNDELCSQLKKKKGSPYLPLYIKELQTHIRQTNKMGNFNKYKKLKEIYDTLFPYSLPSNYIKASPLTAINYVSDRMNAARYLILNKESAITIFFSNQRRKYISKDKSINDSIVFADKCWIINEQSKELIWRPTINSNTSVQNIRVEKYDTILAPGKYLVRYESDGKHSFETWLSFPPLIDDYGIRIYQK